MPRSPTASVRGFALAAAFCVLGGGAGCGRETFNLLANDGAAGDFPGISGSTSGGAAGAGSSAGGGSGAFVDAGFGGQASAGSAGRRSFPEGGTGGTAPPCLGGQSCAGGSGGSCPTSLPFCAACVTNKDCSGETPKCDPDKGRCYQCKGDDDCAPTTEACFLGRCGKRCKTQSDCESVPDHLFCRSGAWVCVGCIYNNDCGVYNNKQNICFVSECVQCTEDRDCMSQSCVAGLCQKPH